VVGASLDDDEVTTRAVLDATAVLRGRGILRKLSEWLPVAIATTRTRFPGFARPYDVVSDASNRGVVIVERRENVVQARYDPRDSALGSSGIIKLHLYL
jgi:hypothetical protein